MTSRPRITRERKTIVAMISMYCRDLHDSQAALCPECQELSDYALGRLDRCPFQEGKTTCARCPVHCYKPDMRERVRTVMRYAGPRMLTRHPLMTVTHMVDGMRKEPVRNGNARTRQQARKRNTD